MKSPRRQRLDTLLVEKGLVESREKARALILAGQVDVDGHGAAKAGTMVPIDADIRVIGPDHPWVSRGGVKLAAALEAFGIDATDRIAFDVGASTGGFTDVWLHARRAPRDRARRRPQPAALEGAQRSARHGDREHQRAAPEAGRPAGCRARRSRASASTCRSSRCATSFRCCRRWSRRPTEIVALVKPQFEAGRKDVGKGGLVTDPASTRGSIAEVTAAAAEVGLERLGLIDSPITGAHGNTEFLMHLGLRS